MRIAARLSNIISLLIAILSGTVLIIIVGVAVVVMLVAIAVTVIPVIVVSLMLSIAVLIEVAVEIVTSSIVNDGNNIIVFISDNAGS